MFTFFISRVETTRPPTCLSHIVDKKATRKKFDSIIINDESTNHDSLHSCTTLPHHFVPWVGHFLPAEYKYRKDTLLSSLSVSSSCVVAPCHSGGSKNNLSTSCVRSINGKFGSIFNRASVWCCCCCYRQYETICGPAWIVSHQHTQQLL